MRDELEKGIRRLEWASTHMKVLAEIRGRMVRERPLDGLKIGMALHVEAKTGILAVALAEAGATVRLASCNPLSTDDSVSLALREHYGLEVYAKKWETTEEYYGNLNSVLDLGPDFLIDDGADLITMVHADRKNLLSCVKGANEETTTGVVRLRSMAEHGQLKFPVISVNDAHMKFLFDNRYGTGQSTFDGWMTATNLLVAGKKLVVAGYGWCGRGIAMRARGLGALVIVTEVNPVRAIEAIMDGFEVMPMTEAVKVADMIISATGCKDAVRGEHLDGLKDGCVLGNSGHFDNEISKRSLDEYAGKPRKVREFIDEYSFPDGRKAYLLCEGRLMNLGAGQGHPVEIMDMSFSIQALSIEHLTQHYREMKPGVYNVPGEIDDQVARLKLKTMGTKIDTLTPEQRKYLTGWQEGDLMARPYLCVYGHTALDYVIALERLPEPNTSVDVIEKKRFFGGTGANMATIAATLGVPTALCSFVGRDLPTDFREFMEGKGVDLKELVSVDGCETPTVWIVSDSTHNQIAYVYQGPMREMDRFEPRMEAAREAEVVHICTGRPNYYVKVMSQCRKLKKHISFDPSQEIHHIWNEETFRKALPLCDTFFANENELRIAMGYMGVTKSVQLLKTVGMLVNTRGSKGSIIYCPGGVYEIPAVTPARIVDTTGAGDAFRAGFYAGKFRGYSVRECAVLGSSTASFVVESVGSLTNIPTWDQVLERADQEFRRL